MNRRASVADRDLVFTTVLKSGDESGCLLHFPAIGRPADEGQPRNPQVEMAEDPDSLVPVMLRRMDAKLDRIGDDLSDLKARIRNVEAAVVDLRRDVVNLHGDIVRIDHRLDWLDERVARIERGLDLVEA